MFSFSFPEKLLVSVDLFCYFCWLIGSGLEDGIVPLQLFFGISLQSFISMKSVCSGYRAGITC